MRKIRLLTAAALLLTAAAVTLTGCGAGNKFSETAAAETAAASADMASGFSAPQAGALANGAFSNTEIAPEESGMTDSADMGLTSENTLQPVSSNRKLIRNVDMYVETTEFDRLLSSLQTSVTDLGGYIEQSNISGNSISSGYENRRYASLTVRIPSAKLDPFVAQVSEQGNITNRSENVQDVTLQYSDIESRKKSLTIEQERLWALLEKADSVDSIIALESRLSEIRYQLESFESQLRTYDNQVDYSTVYLSINEVKVFTATAPDSVMTRIQKGFKRNLEGVANGAVSFLVWFIAGIPVFAVLAVVIAIITLIIRLVIVRVRHRTAKPDTASTPPET